MKQNCSVICKFYKYLATSRFYIALTRRRWPFGTKRPPENDKDIVRKQLQILKLFLVYQLQHTISFTQLHCSAVTRVNRIIRFLQNSNKIDIGAGHWPVASLFVSNWAMLKLQSKFRLNQRLQKTSIVQHSQTC